MGWQHFLNVAAYNPYWVLIGFFDLLMTCKVAEISGCIAFDIIHANASLLINMGVPVKVISEHLGHRDTRTTETIYAHVFAETMVQASNAISEALATVEE